MQHLDVTDDQLAYLERVRATLESEYLGPYGTVGIQDALQYLIDVHEAAAPDMPQADTGVVAAATAGETPGLSDREPATNGADATTTSTAEPVADEATDESEADTETGTTPATEADAESGEQTDAAVDEAVEELDADDGQDEATADAAVEAEVAEDGETDAPDEDAEVEEAAADEEAPDGDATDAETTDETAEDEQSDDGGATAAPGDGGGGNDRLQAMMNLLDTHGDKWREGDGEARYEVDLPDGSTETVQTRDDVRAVLFKNYR